MEAKLIELKARLAEVNDLRAAARLLDWDQSTYMPSGGASARGRQLGTLQRLAHEKFTDGAIGKLLEDLEGYEANLSPDSDGASLIRVTRRDYEKAVRVPPSFAAELSSHSSASYQAWTTARPANDFSAMRPYLEKTLELSRRYADFFPGHEHIADPLIDDADPGMTVATLRTLFADLRAELVPIARAITEQPAADDTCLFQAFPEPEQLDFGIDVIRRYGYDFERGRQDKTHHPFMTFFSIGDVRITNRVEPDYLGMALFSTLHESGHGMYHQGIRPEYEGTPLEGGISSGMHESQSRLWENLIGRSRSFWEFFYPRLQAVFPGQLQTVSLDTFYRAINKVERSLIRIEADEVTYNLHVIIRFDLELDLLEGRLEVRDLPEAWHERYRADLGVAAPDDRDGALQDMHWYVGTVGGMFQGYTLGNILSSQLFDAAQQARPEIGAEIANGEFGALHGWLKEHIYQHGRKYTMPEMIERATGGPLRIEPYISYLRTKFGELYHLD